MRGFDRIARFFSSWQSEMDKAMDEIVEDAMRNLPEGDKTVTVEERKETRGGVTITTRVTKTTVTVHELRKPK